MSDLAGPRHLRNMDQSLDAAFQFDECAVVHQADHLALHPRAHRIFLGNGMPGIGIQLFHAERNAFFLGIELEHDNFDLLANLNDLRWMVDPAPRHIADVQYAVDATQIDECAIARNIFYGAFENDAFLQDF